MNGPKWENYFVISVGIDVLERDILLSSHAKPNKKYWKLISNEILNFSFYAETFLH